MYRYFMCFKSENKFYIIYCQHTNVRAFALANSNGTIGTRITRHAWDAAFYVVFAIVSSEDNHFLVHFSIK